MTFGAPLFLLAILAGAIPVLMHLVNRQRAPSVAFSTLRFLQLSVQQTRRRKRIHDWFLLVLRTLVPILLALALARPAIRSLRAVFVGSEPRAIAIVIDNSASMSTTVQGQSRLARAVDTAESIVRSTRPGDLVAIITTGGAQRPGHRQLLTDRAIALGLLDHCRVSPARSDLVAEVDQAQTLLNSAKTPNKEIYVITDLQATAWQDEQQADKPSEQSKAAIHVIDVHQSEVPNVGIRSVAVDQLAPVAGVPAQITVELYNASDQPRTEHVELYLDNRRLATSTPLTLPPHDVASYQFDVTVEQAGVHSGEVRLAGVDAMVADNSRYFALVLQRELKVGVVQPEHQPISYLNDAYFLLEALRVGGAAWAIQADDILEHEVTDARLAPYSVVFCVNLALTEPEVAAALAGFIRAGGNVIWVLGDRVDVAVYNRANERVGNALLPWQLDEIVEVPPEQQVDSRIDWLDANHPAFASLANPPSLYQSVLVRKYARWQATDDPQVRVLARRGADPVMLEYSPGRQHVIVMGTGTNKGWSNLPLRPIFLPLVAQLTFYASHLGRRTSEVAPDLPWQLTLSGHEPRQIEVRYPDGRKIRPAFDEWKSGQLSIRDTHDAGTYVVTALGNDRSTSWAFCVNVEPIESDLRTVDQATIESRLKSQVTLLRLKGNDNIVSVLNRLRSGTQLWPVFLLLVLALLVGEVWVANRLSDRLRANEAKSRACARRRLVDHVVGTPQLVNE